ncbi:hypothetical protein HPB51_015683 [Rhipicephalus microplus]|uniref:Uncharacterized protein n=1 Tax=Rhipicephalus microplus TaxID=6941 RepID=A0A9J6D5N0_RHIMP|nr:hypothetical protein HPB51_015683 [Rhipicephalus microplus]
MPVVDSAIEPTCAPLQEMSAAGVAEQPPLATSTFAHRSAPFMEGLIQRPTEPVNKDSRYLTLSDSKETRDATLTKISQRYVSCPNRQTSTGPSPGPSPGAEGALPIQERYPVHNLFPVQELFPIKGPGHQHSDACCAAMATEWADRLKGSKKQVPGGMPPEQNIYRLIKLQRNNAGLKEAIPQLGVEMFPLKNASNPKCQALQSGHYTRNAS